MRERKRDMSEYVDSHRTSALYGFIYAYIRYICAYGACVYHHHVTKSPVGLVKCRMYNI